MADKVDRAHLAMADKVDCLRRRQGVRHPQHHRERAHDGEPGHHGGYHAVHARRGAQPQGPAEVDRRREMSVGLVCVF